MKHMLKPFKPAEDRFSGLEGVSYSESNACAVLPDCAAVVECRVASRLEAGDHVVVYATVEGGAVLDDKALSTVHHRRVGSTY